MFRKISEAGRNGQPSREVGARRTKAKIARTLFLPTIVLLAGNGLLRGTARQDKAWNILEGGAAEKGALKRADAVKALGLLPRDSRARTMAEKALGDDNPDVRVAAATALGEMHASASIPKLTGALADKDPAVVLAAAHALLVLKDPRAYDIYYAVLTGQRKAGRGLIAQQRQMLDDPKKLAEFGVETGLGFVPFAGIGVSAYKVIGKRDSGEARAAAAQVLAKDPDPESRHALIEAISDRNYIVRIAALRAIAMRDDSRLLAKIEPSMDDEKDAVQYTAAAAVIRLSETGKSPRLTSDKDRKGE